ncbi:MAG: DNA polymerase IV [Candidatus Peribacteraceae bacterium]|nr:DNA polymerase IV [Candidatus Peribacteraceae bacterium]MDD5742419.1 DNA polymerase IV [Candidatus Peribacteraceae bacterium]
MYCHVDADAFFASVLQRKDPRLRGKPLLALGAGGGIVIAASYPAKRKGVKTGMRLQDAKKLCPDAIALLSDFTEACRASEQIETILQAQTAAVEQMSVDEWFLDLRELVGGIPADLALWAKNVQHTISSSVGIGMSVGIAETKLLAKMASEYRKPAGITIVVEKSLHTAYCILRTAFLKDRPVASIPGIGRARQVHAASLNWQTALDFACTEEKTFVHLFGRPGKDLQQELRGIPVASVVRESAPPKSVSRGRSFRCTRERADVFSMVVRHVSVCTLRMREQHLACRHLTLWVRDAAFRYADAHVRLPRPMDTEDTLLPYVRHCFARLWKHMNGCTQAGVALCNLLPAGPAQYSLFEEPENADRSESVQKTLDTVRARFGRDSIMRATGLQRKSSRSSLPNTFGHIGTTRD